MPKTKCLVIQAFDGSLLVSVDEKVYQLKKMDTHSFENQNKKAIGIFYISDCSFILIIIVY